jgi:phage FluMu protein Com
MFIDDLMSVEREGKDAAFLCDHCGKVFLDYPIIHGGDRKCPRCGELTNFCVGAGREPTRLAKFFNS